MHIHVPKLPELALVNVWNHLLQHTEQQTQEHTFYGYQMVAVCKLSHKVMD